MAKGKAKSKTSAVKRGNRLRTKLQKQGKLKTKRNKVKPKKISRPVVQSKYQNGEDEGSTDNEENVLDMMESEDISFLKSAAANKSYSFLNNANFQNEISKPQGKKRKAKVDDELEQFENEYEQSVQSPDASKKRKYLLPIKTSEGIVVRSEEVCSSDDENETQDTPKQGDKGSKSETVDEFEEVDEVRTIDLVACRESALEKRKIKIGILCSGVTETPEEKIHNLKPLLQMCNESEPGVCITVRKLALVSLLEVFKDLIPEYQIKHHNAPNIKLKKSVKQLQTYESSLLNYYKGYLKEIEKILNTLKRKNGGNRAVKEAQVKLAETALQCMCQLLVAHPYFNFTKNVIHLLVPFLNSSRETIREIASNTIRSVFKGDKRGEVSLEVVRNINKFVKSRRNIVHSEVLSVLLSLNLKDVNLDKEKEEEIKRKKEEAKKSRLMKMSKREKKRMKKFQSLQNDLLETKAEENKKSKEQCMTEITKTIFTIYFRILKEDAVSPKLLKGALEGLAKFAHCINVEFYQDLIVVLDRLIQNESLGYKEKLFCVWTVFTVLHYQGATIYIDPVRFYSHFYSNILHVDAGVNHSDFPVIMKTTDFVLLKRRKHLSLQRLLAFTKRLTALALQVLPNGALALFSLIREILQVNSSTDVLLDSEGSQGQGVYYPEMEEPEYCNACATSLWELLPLQKHYHPTVREFASYLAKTGSNAEDAMTQQQQQHHNKSFLKLSAEQHYEQFNSDGVKFNPAVPTPRKFGKAKGQRLGLLNADLENFMKARLGEAGLNCNQLLKNITD